MRIVLNNTPTFGNFHTGPRSNGRCSPGTIPARRPATESLVNALLRDLAGVVPTPGVARERETSVGLRVLARETPSAWVFVANVPGVPANNLDIGVEDGVVTIRATRSLSGPEGYRLLRGERRGTEATARFELPIDADAENISAALRDGVLELSVGRRVNTARRVIPVEVRGASEGNATTDASAQPAIAADTNSAES